MKRLIIYCNTDQATPQFLVVTDNRFDELDGVFINSGEDDPKNLQDKLSQLFWDEDGGSTELEKSLLDKLPLDQQPFDKVITCGFLA